MKILFIGCGCDDETCMSSSNITIIDECQRQIRSIYKKHSLVSKLDKEVFLAGAMCTNGDTYDVK